MSDSRALLCCDLRAATSSERVSVQKLEEEDEEALLESLKREFRCIRGSCMVNVLRWLLGEPEAWLVRRVQKCRFARGATVTDEVTCSHGDPTGSLGVAAAAAVEGLVVAIGERVSGRVSFAFWSFRRKLRLGLSGGGVNLLGDVSRAWIEGMEAATREDAGRIRVLRDVDVAAETRLRLPKNTLTGEDSSGGDGATLECDDAAEDCTGSCWNCD